MISKPRYEIWASLGAQEKWRLLTGEVKLVRGGFVQPKRQPLWQRMILLCVLGYEGIGGLLGGILLVVAPDGRLMNMPAQIMHGAFVDFLIPGLILIALGLLNVITFFTVLFHTRNDWLFSGLAMGGYAIWFIVEIIILRELHWLHAMWGLPVIAGGLSALSLIPSRTKAQL